MAKISSGHRDFYERIADDVAAFLWRRHRRRRPGHEVRHVPAIVIAIAFKLPGFTRWDVARHDSSNRESLRRRVRELAIVMRERGHPLFADGRGYYMGSDSWDFAKYEALCRQRGLTHLVHAGKVHRSPAADNADGQLLIGSEQGGLFADPAPTSEEEHRHRLW